LADQILVEVRNVVDLVAIARLQTYIHDVRAIANLTACNLRRLFPFFFRDQVLEVARTNHIGALADNQWPIAVFDLDQLDPRVVRTMFRLTQLPRLLAIDHLCDSLDMRWRSTTASADDIQPAQLSEFSQLRSQRVRRLQIFAFIIGQAGIGIARDT